MANHRTILLFDEGLVVLVPGAAAREHDPGVAAIVPHRLVHEHAVIVGVEAEKIERQELAQTAEHCTHQRLLAEQQGSAFRPTRGDIGEHQRLHEAAPRHRAAVRHEIGLHEAGRRVLPVGMGAHRNAAAHR